MELDIKNWSDDEARRLLDLIESGKSYQEAAAILGRTVGSVSAKLKHLRGNDRAREYRPSDKRCTWTPEEDAALLMKYGSVPMAELQVEFGRGEKALRQRVRRLRQAEQNQYRRANILPLNPNAIKDYGFMDFLVTDIYPANGEWSGYDDMRVKLFYGVIPVDKLALAIGRTPEAVKGRVAKLKWSLDKAVEFRFMVMRHRTWHEAFTIMRQSHFDLCRASFNTRQSVVAELEKHLAAGFPIELFIEKQKLKD